MSQKGIGRVACSRDLKYAPSQYHNYIHILPDSSIEEYALKQIGLQKVISSMLDVKDFGEIMDPALVEPRLSLSVIASQLLSGSDEV